jgi:restriction endonuclease S subunit
MSKCHNFPTLYDNCKIINISDLKLWEYLNPNQVKSGVLTWSRNGEKIGSISLIVNIYTGSPYMELDFICNKVPVNYFVQLITIPSNLGRGVVWYFICPRAG